MARLDQNISNISNKITVRVTVANVVHEDLVGLRGQYQVKNNKYFSHGYKDICLG